MSENKLIGVLFSDDSNSGLTHAYFAGVLDGFKRAVEEKGYSIAFLNCNKSVVDRKTYAQQVKSGKYVAVVIACINYDDEEVKELIKSDIPIAVIDEDIENSINVRSNNIIGLKELVNYLCEMGHKRIAYITGDSNRVTTDRLNSFIETCKEHGIEIPPEYIKNSFYRDMKKAARLTEELLRLPEPPSCIMYSDDYAAIGGINVLHARGLEIPKDISVTGFDGIDILSQFEPRLTTVKQDTTQIGRVAADELINRVENGLEKTTKTVVVDTKLEKGRTVGTVFY